jgi:hypothetical protein
MDPLGSSGTARPAPDDGYASDEENIPTGFAVAAGSVVVVASAFVSSAIPASAGAARFGLVAAALGGFAALTVNAVAIAVVGLLAFLVFDGFLVNQLGELSWHGAADVQRLFLLIVVSISGLVAGRGYRVLRKWRLWRQRERWVAAQPSVKPAPPSAPRDVRQPSATKGFLWNRKEISRG